MDDFEPAYPFGDPNEAVVLARTPVTVKIRDVSHSADGEVRLEFLPSPNIYVCFQLPSSVFGAFHSGQEINSLSIGGRDVPGFFVRRHFDTNEPTISVKWTPKMVPLVAVGDHTAGLCCVVFHLMNFGGYIGTRRSTHTDESGHQSIEHLDLASKDWRLEIKSLPQTRKRIEKLQEDGGYGLTHVGWFEKSNGSMFNGKDAEAVINSLRHFFSFARGAWCQPVCAVGFDERGSRVWEQWSTPSEPWKVSFSWFDELNCVQLPGLFPGFMERVDHEGWREALFEAIHWYVKSNTPRSEAGIILSQTAIERLSYEYSVLDRRLISAAGFKNGKLWASEKFRLLFSSLAIPIDIPANLTTLRTMAGKNAYKWADGPHALTEVRNSIVHPENKSRREFRGAFYEAWNLGLWYLELAILRLCGYEGTYSNRLRQPKWVGDVEKVPWQT